MKKKEPRFRSTNLDLVGGVPQGALRRLREIAAQADLPLARVFADVVAIGVSVVGDPAESPYSSLIAFRNGLAAKQQELADVAQHAEVQIETRGISAPGTQELPTESIPPIDRGTGDFGQQEGRTEERFDLAAQQRGFGPEDISDLRLSDPSE